MQIQKKNFNKVLKILLNTKYKNLISSDYSFMPHEELGYMSHYFFYQNVLRKHYNILFKPEFDFNQTIKDIEGEIQEVNDKMKSIMS